MKKINLMLLGLSIFTVSLFAQNHENRDFEFRFLPVNNMFFFEGNEQELARLHKAVDNHIGEIRKGDIILKVDGYSSAFGTEAENLNHAKNRSNQVKSDLIVKKDLKEENYSTRNHATSYQGHSSAVVVKFFYVNKKEEPKQPVVKAEPKKEEPRREEPKKEEPKREEPKPVERPVEPVVEEAIKVKVDKYSYNFALRTNLLHWVALTPNIGIEVKLFDQRIGLLANVDWADWTWKNETRRHYVFSINPEIRYYMGDNRNWYLGAQSHHAWFEMQYNDDLRRVGHFNGVGVIGGYRWDITKAFAMDFNIGVGYTRIHADKSWQGSNKALEHIETKTYIVPNQATVGLVWKIF